MELRMFALVFVFIMSHCINDCDHQMRRRHVISSGVLRCKFFTVKLHEDC